MSLEPPLQIPASPVAPDKLTIAKSRPRVQSAARWFWWIAGLSAINSVVIHTGGDFNFVVGLSVTQLIDGLFENIKVLAVIFDALPLGFFFFAGWFAGRGNLWAFIVGGLAYVIDAGIFAFFGEWLSVGFHAYALFFIYNGAKELRSEIKNAAQVLPPPVLAPTL
jgi:hypothetical protein